MCQVAYNEGRSIRVRSVHQYVTHAATCESGNSWPVIPSQRALPSIIALSPMFNICRCLCPRDLCVLQLQMNTFVTRYPIVFSTPKYLSQQCTAINNQKLRFAAPASYSTSFRVHIPPRTPAVLSSRHTGFSQSVQPNAEMLINIRQWPRFSHSFQFLIRW